MGNYAARKYRLWPKELGFSFFDSTLSFDLVSRALDFSISRGIDTKLYNFPLCTVPADYRAFAPSTISDWKRAYVEDCVDCSLRRLGELGKTNQHWFPPPNHCYSP